MKSLTKIFSKLIIDFASQTNSTTLLPSVTEEVFNNFWLSFYLTPAFSA